MKVASHPALLKLGSTSNRVHVLEERLHELGYLKGPVDSTFDARTQKAVKAYKRDQGWRPVAVVGQRMSHALGLPGARQGTTGTRTPSSLKGATYNCEVGRNPKTVGHFVGQFARSHDLDFIQLQEISTYHDALSKIPGYTLITFPKSKDHGESGVLVRDDLLTQGAQSIQSDIGWKSPTGAPRAARSATSVKLAGWLRVTSVHTPPAIDWKNGHAVGPAQRIQSYGSLAQKLVGFVKGQKAKHPGDAQLVGGDWNEGSSSFGRWSPTWIAAKAGLQKHGDHRIDWEMSDGCKVKNVKVGPSGGSDHRIVTFTVSRG